MPKNLAPMIRTTVLLAASAFALSACEFRRDGVKEEPAPDANGTEAAATPSPTASPSETAAASIIRDENAPENDLELPIEPVELTIPFAEGTTLSANAERMLASIMDSRALEQDWPVILGGHTDSAGNDAANLRASRAQAESVAAWLIERGVEDDRIEVIAFGEQNPAMPNALPDGSPNEEGRRANRRVELRIAPPPSADDENDSEASPRTTPSPRGSATRRGGSE